jgi:hypothetical protein
MPRLLPTRSRGVCAYLRSFLRDTETPPCVLVYDTQLVGRMPSIRFRAAEASSLSRSILSIFLLTQYSGDLLQEY